MQRALFLFPALRTFDAVAAIRAGALEHRRGRRRNLPRDSVRLELGGVFRTADSQFGLEQVPGAAVAQRPVQLHARLRRRSGRCLARALRRHRDSV
jgi:hypothetical protein